MSLIDEHNRLPVLDMLEDEFAEWQVLLLTHDRPWYEVACQRLATRLWTHCELFAARVDDEEVPLLVPDRVHLDRGLAFLA